MQVAKLIVAAFTIPAILCIIAIALLIRRPEIVKQSLIKHYDLRPHVVLGENVFEIPTNSEYKVYEYIVDHSDPTKIIIDIPGGAFISAAPTFTAYKQLRLPCNVISFEYPVLFKHHFSETLGYLEMTIGGILKKRPQVKSVYVVGTSAGAYFAVKLLNRGKLHNIKKFLGICGYYGHKTIPKNLSLAMMEHLYVTSFANNKNYDCHIIPNPVNVMLITATNDFLYESTKNFAALSTIAYDTYEGNHLFFHDAKTSGAKKAYAKVNQFLAAEEL